MAGTSEIAVRADKAKLLKSMPKAWQKNAVRALKINKGRARSEVLSRFDMGEIVINMADDEKKYGTHAVVNLAKFLDVGEVELWVFRRIATAFTKPELEKMLTQTFKNGGRWGYAHIAQLASVTDDRKRLALQKAVVKQSLTSRQLTLKIQKKLGDRTVRNKEGRKPNMPKSISGGLTQIKQQAVKIDHYMPGWEQAVFKRLREATPESLNADLLSQLKETRANEVKLQSSAKKVVQQLDVAITRVEHVVSKRKAKKKKKTTASSNGQATTRVAAAKKKAATRKKKKKTKIVKKVRRKKKKSVSGRPAAA